MRHDAHFKYFLCFVLTTEFIVYRNVLLVNQSIEDFEEFYSRYYKAKGKKKIRIHRR
jgi:hypothetical protein